MPSLLQMNKIKRTYLATATYAGRKQIQLGVDLIWKKKPTKTDEKTNEFDVTIKINIKKKN